MPDRLIDLLIQLCLQNNVSISARKESAQFDSLTDEELSAMEQAVKDSYNRRNQEVFFIKLSLFISILNYWDRDDAGYISFEFIKFSGIIFSEKIVLLN